MVIEARTTTGPRMDPVLSIQTPVIELPIAASREAAIKPSEMATMANSALNRRVATAPINPHTGPFSIPRPMTAVTRTG